MAGPNLITLRHHRFDALHALLTGEALSSARRPAGGGGAGIPLKRCLTPESLWARAWRRL